MGSLTCGGRSHRMPQTSGRRRGRPRKRKHEAAEPKLLEAILNPANLEGAWRSVKANAGAAGIDGMSVEAFPAFWQKDRERIVAQLNEGSYRPAAVRRVWIPKGNREERPLGVPTVLDRVIQQAIAQILSLIFEGQFSAHSHGFRPGRRAQDAVKSIQEAAREGYVHAVDCDLKSFFDKVNHGELMQRLRRRIQDGRVLHLIGCYLKAGVRLPDGKTEATPAGVPQGGPLSPLLANIMLDDLDHELERRGHRFARLSSSSKASGRQSASCAAMGVPYKDVRSMDQWLRRRVRLCYWKQWKQPKTRFRNLLKLGINRSTIKQASRCRKGYWRCSNLRVVCIAMNNDWLNQQGCPSIKEQWKRLCYPNG